MIYLHEKGYEYIKIKDLKLLLWCAPFFLAAITMFAVAIFNYLMKL